MHHIFMFKNLLNVQKVNQQSICTCLYDIFMLDFYLLPGPFITTVRNTKKTTTYLMCENILKVLKHALSKVEPCRRLLRKIVILRWQ